MPDDWFIGHNEVITKVDDDLDSETWLELIPDLEETKALRARRRAAKQACWDCPLQARLECLQIGMTAVGLEFGIWGGYDVPERKAFRRAADERSRLASSQTERRRLKSAMTGRDEAAPAATGEDSR